MYRYRWSYHLSFVLCILGTFILCRYYWMMTMMIKPACCVSVCLSTVGGGTVASGAAADWWAASSDRCWLPWRPKPLRGTRSWRPWEGIPDWREQQLSTDLPHVRWTRSWAQVQQRILWLWWANCTWSLPLLLCTFKTQMGKVGIFKSRVCSRCSKCFEFDFLKCNYWKTLKVGLFLT